MTKRKATLEEAQQFIHTIVHNEGTNSLCNTPEKILIVLKKIYPFSWQKYCDEKDIQAEIKKGEMK